MKKHAVAEIKAAFDRKADELRRMPGFTGGYVSEAPDRGAFLVLQFDPLDEKIQQQALELLPGYPVDFRRISIAKAY